MATAITSQYVALTQQRGGDEEQHVVIVNIDEDARSIPFEARDLTWNDTYYADNQIEMIAVFDINYEKIRHSIWSRGMWCIVFIFAVDGFFVGIYTLPSGVEVVGLHVAVTKEGIRVDMNKDPGVATTTIIPFNEIKDIKAQRSSCDSFDMGTVHVESSANNTCHSIQGLTDNSAAFISLVNAMIDRNSVIHDDVENST